jgi:D-arabinose 1-dehydrogenase-like Zn-dependent alcohol dehydrogenase
MRAMKAVPGRAESATLAEVPDPEPREDEYLVESILVGLCGSDRELLYRSEPGDGPLTIGHEPLGRIVSVPDDGVLREGDLVVGTIRNSCEACPGCAVGRFDLCEQAVVRERGLFALDGFGSDRWVARESALIPVPTVPTQVVEDVLERVQGRLVAGTAVEK